MKKQNIIKVLLLILFLGVSMFFVLKAFLNEETNNTYHSSEYKENENHVSINARIIGVDLLHEKITLRLDFKPHGKYATKDGNLFYNLEFHSSGISMKMHPFKKGLRMFPYELILDMKEGEVENYPFDLHKTDLEMRWSKKKIKRILGQLHLYPLI